MLTFSYLFAYSFIHSHSSTHSLIHSFIHLLSHLLLVTQFFTHKFMFSPLFNHPLLGYSLTHSAIHPLPPHQTEQTPARFSCPQPPFKLSCRHHPTSWCNPVCPSNVLRSLVSHPGFLAPSEPPSLISSTLSLGATQLTSMALFHLHGVGMGNAFSGFL